MFPSNPPCASHLQLRLASSPKRSGHQDAGPPSPPQAVYLVVLVCAKQRSHGEILEKNMHPEETPVIQHMLYVHYSIQQWLEGGATKGEASVTDPTWCTDELYLFFSDSRGSAKQKLVYQGSVFHVPPYPWMDLSLEHYVLCRVFIWRCYEATTQQYLTLNSRGQRFAKVLQ